MMAKAGNDKAGQGGRRGAAAFCALGAVTLAMLAGAGSTEAAAPQVLDTGVSSVTQSGALLKAMINPQGNLTRYQFQYGPVDCASHTCTSVPVPKGEIIAGTEPVKVSFPLEGLQAAALMHFRVVAESLGGKVTTPDRVFATYGPILEGLPDSRGYEQASPVDKDGGDALGKSALVKAATDGGAISFNSSFGIPGGVGAQVLPTYLAKRGEGNSGWSTEGLLPPFSFGERAKVQGHLPDFSETFGTVTKLGEPRTQALLAQSTDGGPARLLTPYRPEVDAEISYAGASLGGDTVFFEAGVRLPAEEDGAPIPGSIEGVSNLYVWSAASGKLSLAGVMNDGKSPSRGAFAGPYDWASGSGPAQLRGGGGARSYYLQDEHVITPGGDVYFTVAGSGQFYLRLNPTQPQSEMEGEKCLKPADACTIHVSASRRTTPGPDPAGPQPAAFQGANTDGSVAYFTSPEKLTNESNTGPEQPEAAIARGGLDGTIEDEGFIPTHALGIAVDAGYIYWADPATGTIGRAELGNPASADDSFIEPGDGHCKATVENEAGEDEIQEVDVPSSPRYVAVDAGYVYWTNTGRTDANGKPIIGGGTIGRAKLEGDEATEVEADFICGEEETSPGVIRQQVSEPQGIAVGAGHLYWSNAVLNDLNKRTIARADLTGGEVKPFFYKPTGSRISFGLAANGSDLYFAADDDGNHFGFVGRVSLGGGEAKYLEIGEEGIRGVAVDAGHVYWAAQREGSVGRASVDLEEASLENKFIPVEGTPAGVAVDASHLYWSVNGEAPRNPGNDLYRYEPESGVLKDLTFVPPPGNGAEVQGVLGISADGSRLYFAANGDLDGTGPATVGDCHGPVSAMHGSCSIYAWHEGQTSFVARVKGGGSQSTDALDWAATPREVFGSSSYTPKTSFVSEDGKKLLFRSQENPSAYDSEGVPEFYLYSAEDGSIRCTSCNPSGEAPSSTAGPGLGRMNFPSGSSPPGSVAAYASRNMNADGSRVFFETPEALSPADTNGQGGCPPLLGALACLDVYEWEAPGAGSCSESSPSYSPLDEGCLYLVSTGKSKFPSQIADASASGGDVFFFTRQGLVGQDKDELQDVYDARVEGGLASQNPQPTIPCEGAEACHGPLQAPPGQTAPASAGFQGPGDPVPHRGKHRAKKHKKKKHTAHKRRAAKNGGRR